MIKHQCNNMYIDEYVHGYTGKEAERLSDQAGTLEDLLHHDTCYPAGCMLLEAGCGIGAQTEILVRRCPGANIISVDISSDSIRAAKDRILKMEGFVEFLNCDIFGIPFRDESFDHIFVCFVLEHLKNPALALHSLKKLLRKGGSLTVIEGDHGSAFFHPSSSAADRDIKCLVDLQARKGGDALIGRSLYPLMDEAGFSGVTVSPRMVYVDSSRPGLVEGFTKKTFTAMVEGVKADAIESGLITEEEWEEGISALYRTTESDGVFCYTFFRATGYKKA